jgi:hypothetical protein
VPPELLGEPGLDMVDLEYEFLESARNPHAPSVVAEVAFQLADDGWHRVRAEGDTYLGVVTVDRLHQSQGGDLVQIRCRLAASTEPAGKPSGLRQADLDGPATQIGPLGVAGGSPRHLVE